MILKINEENPDLIGPAGLSVTVYGSLDKLSPEERDRVRMDAPGSCQAMAKMLHGWAARLTKKAKAIERRRLANN